VPYFRIFSMPGDSVAQIRPRGCFNPYLGARDLPICPPKQLHQRRWMICFPRRDYPAPAGRSGRKPPAARWTFSKHLGDHHDLMTSPLSSPALLPKLDRHNLHRLTEIYFSGHFIFTDPLARCAGTRSNAAYRADCTPTVTLSISTFHQCVECQREAGTAALDHDVLPSKTEERSADKK